MEKAKTDLTLFENHKIRRIFDEKTKTWYFSVVDVVAALTDQKDSQTARKYWNKLSQRLRDEGSEMVTKCHRLKLESTDGKKYLTDVADTETMLRLIQSIPSPRAEPIKVWLAKVGYQRIQEMNDPEIALNRSREYWKKHGRSEKWIQMRMSGQETRNKLTDYWSDHEVEKGSEFAILTSIIHEEWTDLTIAKHKKLKGLKNQNLRDHMSEEELLFTALAELSTRKIAEAVEAVGLEENKLPAKQGGKIAKNARVALEEKTGQKVLLDSNYLKKSKSELNKLKTIKIPGEDTNSSIDHNEIYD
jgi:DNA-damage-inducible protein D